MAQLFSKPGSKPEIKDLGNKIMYVNQVPTSGWLDVQPRDARARVPLLEYTKLQMLTSAHGRTTTFLILDGAQKGITASLSDANAKIYLGEKAPLQTGVSVMVQYGKLEDIPSISRRRVFVQQTASLSVNGLKMRITLNTHRADQEIMHEPIPPGLYKIRLPDNPHDKAATEIYRNIEEPGLKNDQVWFPIEYGDNKSYIHVGHVSHGCVTVMQLEKWNELYQALIEHRMSGGDYVGQLLVSRTPPKRP